MENANQSADQGTPTNLQLLSLGQDKQDASQRTCQLDCEIQALKQRHNASSPLAALPADIVYEVLLTLRARCGQDQRAWIAATHVCKSLRTLAIDFPALWTELPIINERFTRGILHRSKDLTLSITFDHLTSNSIPLACDLLRQTHRLRSVELKYVDGPEFQSILLDGVGPAPCLETLRIERINRLANSEGLPKGFLHTPSESSLKRLVLQGCCVPWDDLPLAPSLTSFTLGSRRRADRCPSFPRFLDTLGKLTQLVFLSLGGRVFPVGGQGSNFNGTHRHQQVCLPRLDHLQIYDDDWPGRRSETYSSLPQVLSALKLPSATIVWLRYADRPLEVAEDLARPLEALKGTWLKGGRRVMDYGIGALSCRKLPDRTWKDDRFSCVFKFGEPTASPSGEAYRLVGVKLQVEFSTPLDKLDALVMKFKEVLDLAPVRRLWLPDTRRLSLSQGWMGFHDVSRIDYDTVHHTTFFNFLRALESGEAPPFPKLATVHVQRIDFTSRNDHTPGMVGRAIAQVLQKRAQSPFPLESVTFKFVGCTGIGKEDKDAVLECAIEGVLFKYR